MSLVLGPRCCESVVLCETASPLFFAYCSSLFFTSLLGSRIFGVGTQFRPHPNRSSVAARVHTLTSPDWNTKTRT